MTGCSGPPPRSATTPESTEQTGAEVATIELAGMPGFSFEDFGLDLEDLGYDVSADGVISPTTDLLLVVVSLPNGPMRQTREAIQSLAGSVIPRVAIALTDVDKVDPDPEIEALVVREVVDLLEEHGLAPVDYENLVRWPGREIESTVELHLRRAPRDYHLEVPVDSEPPSPEGPVEVSSFSGVPLADALRMLEVEGLVGEVIADPALGSVSHCDPLVQDQVPSSGVMLDPGGTVGLIVPPPDNLDPELAACLLPELSRIEIDARRAELSAQPHSSE